MTHAGLRPEITDAIARIATARNMGDMMAILALAQTKEEAAALREAYRADLERVRPHDADAVVSENIEGMIECPMHGLRIHADTGIVASISNPDTKPGGV